MVNKNLKEVLILVGLFLLAIALTDLIFAYNIKNYFWLK